jgi:hypothetical protein
LIGIGSELGREGGFGQQLRKIAKTNDGHGVGGEEELECGRIVRGAEGAAAQADAADGVSASLVE